MCPAVCILKGSVMFFVDLVKKIQRPVELEFMKVSSYGAGTKTSGCINLHLDIKRNSPRLLPQRCWPWPAQPRHTPKKTMRNA